MNDFNYQLQLQKLEEKLQDLGNYAKYIELDDIYDNFDSDDIEILQDADVIKMNDDLDMFEVVGFTNYFQYC